MAAVIPRPNFAVRNDVGPVITSTPLKTSILPKIRTGSDRPPAQLLPYLLQLDLNDFRIPSSHY